MRYASCPSMTRAAGDVVGGMFVATGPGVTDFVHEMWASLLWCGSSGLYDKNACPL